MKKIIYLLILSLVFCLGACNSEKLNFGKKLVKAQSMTDILTELKAKTSDVGIMDSIMAGYYLASDNSFKNSLMVIDGLTFKEEEYGIACRKEGAYTAAVISNTIVELTSEGKVLDIATKYGLENEIITTNQKIDLTNVSGKEDYDYIVGKGKLVIGYTLFAPIAYMDGNELIGFDIDLAKAVGEKLGVTVEFQKINWDSKEFELSSKNIDCIWNGMTITDERKESMSITIPYMKNKQVAVIRIEDKDKYKTTGDMKNAIIVVESGSAGQDIVTK